MIKQLCEPNTAEMLPSPSFSDEGDGLAGAIHRLEENE